MQRTLPGAAALLPAIAFNLPFALLAQSFDCQDILRRPAGEVLDAFAAGGAPLILTWYVFALSAVGLIAFARALALATADRTRRPGLETAFTLLNGWGGVAIGEHPGRILTLGWVTLATLQALATRRRFAKAAAVPAALTTLGIGIGLGEGLSIALGLDAPLLAMATLAGYLAFSLWLVVTGAGLIAHSFFPPRQTL